MLLYLGKNPNSIISGINNFFWIPDKNLKVVTRHIESLWKISNKYEENEVK